MASLDDIFDAYAAGNPNPAKQVNPNYSEASAKITDKLAEVRAASAAKREQISQFRAELAGQTGLFQAQQEAAAKSVVGRLDLDPDSTTGRLVNLGAGFVAGGSSKVLGTIASLPHSTVAMLNDGTLDAEDTNAYNRFVQGKATPEDMTRLNTQLGVATASGTVVARTKLDVAREGQASRQVARKINDFFNIDSIIHQGSKQKMDAKLVDDFSENWDKVTSAFASNDDQGFMWTPDPKGMVKPGNIPLKGKSFQAGDMDFITDKSGKTVLVPRNGGKEAYAKTGANYGEFKDWDSALAYMQEANLAASKQPNQKLAAPIAKGSSEAPEGLGERAQALASGIAGLLLNAGDAAVSNPAAVAQYVSENAAQLVTGVFGAAGRVAMATSNFGYAADYYQKGIEKFQAENNGQLPSPEHRAEIAGWAASLAVAEQLGDKIGLHAMNLGKKAEVAAAKASILQAFKGTAKATAQGTLGETLTEGYQTFAEGQAMGTPASAEDIYKGAVIGGLTGGAMSGGIRALGEVTGATPEKAEARAKKLAETVVFNEAVAKNDPAVFLNPEAPQYNPSLAVGVLLQHNMSEQSTQESRIENFQKATQIMSTLNDRMDEIKEELKSDDTAVVKAARAEREALNLQIQDGQARWNSMFDEMNKEITSDATEDVPDTAINLSMASINHISPQKAEQMAEDAENGLNDDQRNFLRSFSAARLAYNEAQTLGKVTKTVLEGNPDNMGIKQYRERIGLALTGGNESKARSDLDLLTKFASSHAEKAAVAQEAFDKYGDAGQVYKTEQGWGYAAPGTYKTEELRQGGQFPMIKPRLLKAVRAEAKALAAARDEMTYAVTLKFGPTKTTSAPVQSVATTPAPSAKQSATPGSTPVAQENTAPSEKVITPPHGKEDARLSSPTPEPVVATPQSAIQAEEKAEADKTPVAVEKATESVVPSISEAPSPESAPDSTVADAPVSQVTDPAALATPVKPAPVTTAVEAVNEKGEKDAPYKAKKLGDFFTQDGTVLSTAKDYLSSMKITRDGTPESSALAYFQKVASHWQAAIKTNLDARNKPEYNYEDGMQFFIRPDGDIEENVKTAIAYAAYSYVAENFGKRARNTAAEINALLGREKDVRVDAEERALLGDTMVSLPALIDSLGQRVVQSLGLKTLPNTPVNEMARLQAALGAHAMRLLIDGDAKNPPMMNLKYVDPKVIEAMRKRGKRAVDTAGLDTEVTSGMQSEVFLEVNRDEARNPVEPASNIVKVNKGSKSIINRTFAAEDVARPPTFEPVTKTRKYAKRTRQLVPSFLQRTLRKLNNQPNYIRQDKVEILSRLGDSRFLSMMGVKENTESVHIAKRDALEAKNEGLARELSGIKEFINDYLAGDLDKAFYFEHYAMKQQRVGIANSMVNPQLSKIHRFMVYRSSWKATIDMADTKSLENFVLRAAEGLGVKTDKNSRTKALADFRAKFNSPEIQAGIAALTKIETGEDLSETEKDAIVEAVAFGGENAHSLDALMALTKYDMAVKAKQTTFEVNMLAEVDGVTNGPMLSHLLMGAAGSVKELFAMLYRGGFYDADDVQFNDWRSAAGNEDLYETTTRNTLDRLAYMVSTGKIDNILLAYVMRFMGKLEDKETGKIEKAGRNMIKTPLTAMVYGSGIKTAIEGMAADFIDNIYTRMEEAYKKRDTAEGARIHKETVDSLFNFGINIDRNIGIADLMELQFDKKEEELLVSHFMETLGKAVEATIRDDFKQLLDNRQKFNSVASITYDMFNAAYTAQREELVREMVKAGEIDADGAGNPIHDLTPAQEKILNERMAKVTPVLQTAMSNLSGEATANTGMLIASTKMEPSKTLPYKAVVHFSNGFKQFGGKVAKTLTVYGRHTVNTDPGVGLGATSTHSFDSAVSHSAIGSREVLNLHDAHGTGVNDLVAAGERLNKAVWDRAMEYSPAQEMYNSFMRTVQGMDELLKSGAATQEVAINMARSLVAQSKKSSVWNPETRRRTAPIPAATILMTRAIEAKRLAFDAATIQYGAMAEMRSIAQYAVEGGNYKVTDTDRAAAKAKLERFTPNMPDEDVKLIQSVMDQIKHHVEAAMLDEQKAQEGKGQTKREKRVSDLGTIGKPAVKSDLALVNFLRKNPNITASQFAAFLKTQQMTDFESKLLSSLMKALGARAANYKVRFISADSVVTDVMERPQGASHAWFVSKDGKSELYFLSPEFMESGLTMETSLHELTHAAVAHAIANPNPDTKALIDELEAIRAKAAQVVYDGKMTEFAPAVESVQELVAYGMTNPAFQAVLDSFAHTTQNADNKWVSGLKAFIDTLVKLIFNRESDTASTGLTGLITNVSGLMAASAHTKASKGYINQSMAAPLASLNGEEMYDALAQLGTTRLDPSFDMHLRNVLNLMDESVHSPLAAMKQAAMAKAPQTPMELWRDMKDANVAMFAKNALASGFNFTEQEAFALEQVEATIRVALATKDGSTSALYRELATLYRDTRNELKNRVADFHPNTKQAQALYDFVFKMEPGMGEMSDYLSRFAALGLVNHEFAKLLNFATPAANPSLAGMSVGEKLHALFERFLEWINQRATNTFKGQKADEKLDALVVQLVSIEQRKRMKLAQSAGVALDTFENMFRGGLDTVRDTVVSVANSPFFKNSTNGVVRLTGSITTVIANDRINQYLDAVQKFRDMTMRERQGLMMGMVNEVRGSHALNKVFYKLLRLSKHNEGVRKELITTTATFVMDSFKDGGSYLTEELKKALSYGILRTDVAALVQHFDMDGIRSLFDNRAELDKAIAQWEGKLTGFTHNMAYINGAKTLALYLATGEVGAENLRLNADNIAAMLGTDQAGKVPQADIDAAAAIIDPLVSLYAIGFLDKAHRKGVAKVFAGEGTRTDKGNGIEAILKLHKDLQQQSKDRLFQAAGPLRMKGYTPEIYNPYIRLEVANTKDGAALEERGFTKGRTLQMDDADPGKVNDMHIYKLRDGGLVQYLTGIFSYTGQRKRGTPTHNGDLGLLSQNGLMNRTKMARIAADQKNAIDAQSVRRIDPKRAAESRNFLVPVFNDKGEVVNYRYMMSHAAKDGLLERDNSFDQILGAMAGNIFDKESTKEHNATAVQALYDQYKGDFAQNTASYLEVGPNSKDPEAREVWNLLPEDTRESVRQIWGTNYMMVRFDLLDINFGYRKLSAATPFGIPEDERTKMQEVYVEMLEAVMGKKAELYVRRLEEGWQTLVREAKDTLVVKSGMTLLGNFTSNISELIWFGVPLSDIWRHHRTALKGITAYRKDSKRLAQLETAVRLDHLQGRDRKEVEREIVQLKDALARNPVRELVDAGLMPTIVEDVSQEDDKFSYKGQITKKVDDFVGNLNPVVLQAGKYLVMAHDTPMYKALAYGTQVSDFVARYTLYQHMINRAKKPMKADDAIQLVSDAFVNYDVPSHRTLQYANDMGLVYFSKYYLRIQKVIALLYQQNPGRAMMLLTMGHFLDFMPMLTHSAMLGRIGNPFSTGAFEALSSLDELLTVQTLMTPFR